MGSYSIMCMQGNSRFGTKRSAKDVDQELVKQQKLYYYEKQLHKVRQLHKNERCGQLLNVAVFNDT